MSSSGSKDRTVTDGSPGGGTDGPGSALCVAWVRAYTARLPQERRKERREEIASDLWEHSVESTAAGSSRLHHQMDVIARVLSGIPADLSWRREILRSSRPATGGSTMSTKAHSPANTALIVVVALGIVAPVAMLPVLGSALVGTNFAELAWILGALALACALFAGLVLRDRRPIMSTVLLVVGSVAPSLAVFWLPPVYLLTIAIIVLALATVPGRPVVSGSGPSPA